MIKIKQWFILLASLWAAAACFPAFAAQGKVVSARPNVIVILADDMGHGDIRVNNPASAFATPHLDRMVAGGMNFSDAHTSSSVCTPTRYSLLTGRYNWRSRLKQGVFDGFSPPLIESDRPTLASVLKASGYSTACLGKWHVGMQWTMKNGQLETRDRDTTRRHRRTGEEIDFEKPITGGPNALGFDYYFGIAASLDMSPYAWIENDRCLMKNPRKIERSEEIGFTWDEGLISSDFEMTRVLPELKRRTVEWIETHAKKSPGQPFFLYLPLNSPHLPIVPSKEFQGRSGKGIYGDFVLETDDFVGAVFSALQRSGADENTLVVFTSDNGGLWHAWDPVEDDDVKNYQPNPRGKYNRDHGHQSNGSLRGTKADIWEGGHRVPFIVRWPKTVAPGSRTDVAVEVTDLFATIVDAAGLALPANAAPDSFSFLPALTRGDGSTLPRPFLVHHSIWAYFAIREGDWKYVEGRGSGGFGRRPRIEVEASDPVKGQLYNLKVDRAETQNVYLQNPERVAHFNKLMEQLRAGNSTRSGYTGK